MELALANNDEIPESQHQEAKAVPVQVRPRAAAITSGIAAVGRFLS